MGAYTFVAQTFLEFWLFCTSRPPYTWSVFVESLRDSFATRVGREQEVNQWQELKHTDSIDDFLDSLTNLMWRTGYSEEVVKDKMVCGPNKEIGLAWAQTP